MTETLRRDRLIAVTLDEASIGHGNSEQEHERAVAIYDLTQDNVFGLPDHDGGPYRLHIGLLDSKLALHVQDEAGVEVASHILSMSPFRGLLKDYFLVCESYYAAVRTANVLGKERRRGKFAGYRPDWKKAYVSLEAGHEIDFMVAE